MTHNMVSAIKRLVNNSNMNDTKLFDVLIRRVDVNWLPSILMSAIDGNNLVMANHILDNYTLTSYGLNRVLQTFFNSIEWKTDPIYNMLMSKLNRVSKV